MSKQEEADGLHEYRRATFTVSANNLKGLQALGDEGWEAVSAHYVELSDYEFLFRRPLDRAGGSDTWEYHLFEWFAPSSAIKAHLESCGWVELIYISHYYRADYLVERPVRWRGTDDGDVVARLNSLGYYCNWRDEEVDEVLKVKWDQSGARGHNIGTYEAVRYWLARVLVPRLLEKNGCAPPGGDPEAFLGELLRLRSAGHGTLERTVEYWLYRPGPEVTCSPRSSRSAATRTGRFSSRCCWRALWRRCRSTCAWSA